MYAGKSCLFTIVGLRIFQKSRPPRVPICMTYAAFSYLITSTLLSQQHIACKYPRCSGVYIDFTVVFSYVSRPFTDLYYRALEAGPRRNFTAPQGAFGGLETLTPPPLRTCRDMYDA